MANFVFMISIIIVKTLSSGGISEFDKINSYFFTFYKAYEKVLIVNVNLKSEGKLNAKFR